MVVVITTNLLPLSASLGYKCTRELVSYRRCLHLPEPDLSVAVQLVSVNAIVDASFL